MPIEDEFVQIGGLLGSQAMEAQVIEDEQVGGQEGPEGAVCRVVHSGLGQGLEEVISMAEAHGMSGSDGGVAQGLGEEALADTGGAHQQDVLVPVEKLQGEDGVQQRRSRVIDADQSKSSRRQVSSKPAPCRRSSVRRWARRLTSSLRMISRNEA